MPKFPTPNPDLTREQALNMILSSIALEEVALSHIINAEGEKIQYIIGQLCNNQCAADPEGVLAVNKSVTSLLEMVMQNQLLLKNKMQSVLEYLPKPPPPPKPPKPPWPPCPPPPRPCHEPDCCHCSRGCEDSPQSLCNQFTRFKAVPGIYNCGKALFWEDDPCREHFAIIPGECSRILLSHVNRFKICFVVELCSPRQCNRMETLELQVLCAKRPPATRLFYQDSDDSRTIVQGSMVVELPDCCPCCFVSLLARTPEGTKVNRGRISFTRV